MRFHTLNSHKQLCLSCVPYSSRFAVYRGKGFTFIELMVVIVLVSVVAAIGIPNFIKTVERSTIRSHVNDLIATLHYARSQAITRGTYVTVCRTTNNTSTVNSANCNSNSASIGGVAVTGDNWATGWIVYVDDSSSGTLGVRDSGELLLKRFQSVKSEYSILRNGPGSQSITFNAEGQFAGMDSNGMNFAFATSTSASEDERTICIARGGRIRVIETAVSSCTGLI